MSFCLVFADPEGKVSSMLWLIPPLLLDKFEITDETYCINRI